MGGEESSGIGGRPEHPYLMELPGSLPRDGLGPLAGALRLKF